MGFPLTEIEIRRAEDGLVALELSGAAASLADDAGVEQLAVSISHEAGFATAVVVASAL